MSCLVDGASTTQVSLDKFLHKNTSEDNSSFVDIMETSENNRKRRFAWLYEKEGLQDEVRIYASAFSCFVIVLHVLATSNNV